MTLTRTQLLSLPLPVALLTVALALWLAAGPPGRAATAEQQQGTTVQVEGKEISWAANGSCAPAGFGTADFGTSPPGGGNLYSPDLLSGVNEACVLSNASWSVDAVATDLIEQNEPNSSIPAEEVALTALGRTEAGLLLNDPEPAPADPVPASIPQTCDGVQEIYCSLGNGQLIASGEPSPETTGFLYRYQLTVPPATQPGTYTGSVTFTASN